ncbi:MAG: signal peptidase I [Bacteroidetes bacterium]|nr:S26 family signal peptidase [Rhodothermaceae bacterium RA]RMH67164.1 MAG: signal peptidase I [Bacteroidota bacterium]
MASSSTARARRREERRKKRLHAERQRRDGSPTEEAPPPKSKLREWFDALVFAFVVMLIVRTLFFDLFKIPTPSMEKNLLVGDFLFVSKLHYGTRLPMGICVPFTDLCVPGVRFPYTRIPGFSEVQRGDAMVFNYPPEDKMVDRKTHYIKRVIGMPGETIEVRDKLVHVDGTPLPLADGMQQNWKVLKENPRVLLSEARLAAVGARELRLEQQYPNGLLYTTRDQYERLALVQGTTAAVQSLQELPYVQAVEPAVAAPHPYYSAHLYPPGRGFTPDNYGPVRIPAAGLTVSLDEETWPLYEPVIRHYEGHTTREVAPGVYEIDGAPATSYTFAQDYFFVMGDNRDNSEDSRFWGFVPMDHVVGKAILIYFSKEPTSFVPRFSRFFKPIQSTASAN